MDEFHDSVLFYRWFLIHLHNHEGCLKALTSRGWWTSNFHPLAVVVAMVAVVARLPSHLTAHRLYFRLTEWPTHPTSPHATPSHCCPCVWTTTPVTVAMPCTVMANPHSHSLLPIFQSLLPIGYALLSPPHPCGLLQPQVQTLSVTAG